MFTILQVLQNQMIMYLRELIFHASAMAAEIPAASTRHPFASRQPPHNQDLAYDPST